MPSPSLQTPPQSPKMPPPGPELVDKYERQALGRLQGPKARIAKQAIKELGEIAKDTVRREAIIAADEAISAGTTLGPDEIPVVGEVIMGTEAAVGAYQTYKLAQNVKRTGELIALLAALAAEVQVQEDKKKKVDCSGATS